MPPGADCGLIRIELLKNYFQIFTPTPLPSKPAIKYKIVLFVAIKDVESITRARNISINCIQSKMALPFSIMRVNRYESYIIFTQHRCKPAVKITITMGPEN